MKTYVKPDVYYEDFELAQHIATCSWDMSNQSSKNNCSAEPDGAEGTGMAAFIDGNNLCDQKIEPEFFCWTNSGENNTVFNS